MLLRTELLIPSMSRFSADIGDAGFLVLKDVEPFAVHCAVLEFVARKRGVEFFLFCRLRRVRTEAGLGKQRRGVVCLHAGTAGKENDAAGGQDENQARVSYSGFHGSLRVDWLRLAVENASTAGVNSIFRLSQKCNNHARVER